MARARIIRLAGVAILLGALLLAGSVTGLFSRFSTTGVREIVQGAGPWGALLFIALFAFGQLLQVPAMVFCIAGVLAFGRVAGGTLAYLGSLCSITVSFFFVRGIGGQPLAEIENRRVRALLARLDERPLIVVFVLRLLFLASPPITYALALSKIRYREYFVGSAAGLVIPVAGVAALVGIWFH
jgi:uncharacterized membrane protein YdjX (TVP38/TMEM64 family)